MFAPLGREYEFVLADKFDNEEVKELIKDGLNTEEKGNVFNNKTREMKRLCYLYRHDEKVKIDHRADAYVFLLDKNTNAALKGYMPRTNSEGFVFVGGADMDKERVSETLIHELCHGLYGLQHTFDYGVAETAPSDNIMSYSKDTGRRPSKYFQWYNIENPKDYHFPFTDSAEDGESMVIERLPITEAIRKANKEGDYKVYLYNPKELIKNTSNLISRIVTQYEKQFVTGIVKYLGKTIKYDVVYDEQMENAYLMNNNSYSFRSRMPEKKDDELTWTKTYTFYELSALEIQTAENPRKVSITISKSDEMYFEAYLGLLDLTLSVEEIKEVRERIKNLEKEEKEQAYLDLQWVVPYHSQTDNESKTDGAKTWNMCNLTSLAMCLEYFGMSKPCSDCPTECNKYAQFEDYLKCVRYENNLGFRESSDSWKKLSKQFGLKCVDLRYDKNKDNVNINGKNFGEIKEYLIKKISDELKSGNAVLMSVWKRRGHIVKVISISKNGIYLDDPNGNIIRDAILKCNGTCVDKNNTKCDNKVLRTGFYHRQEGHKGGYEQGKINNINDKKNNAKGRHNFWSWDEITNVTMHYICIIEVNSKK